MKYTIGIDAAIKYLKKKEDERSTRKPLGLALIPWVIGMLAGWVIVVSMYWGY